MRDILERVVILLEDNPDITDDGELFTGQEVLQEVLDLLRDIK